MSHIKKDLHDIMYNARKKFNHKHSHLHSDNADILKPKIIECFQKGYSFKDFLKDIVGGFTVSIVSLPLAMAFAIASGLSPIYGLYTVIIVGVIGAITTGCKFQVSGPSGTFAVILYSVIYHHGLDGLLVTLILAGGLLLLGGLLRVGSLIKFIPYPVTMGFTTGIGCMIASQQLADFLGIPATEIPPEFFEKWFFYFQNLENVSLLTLLFSFATIGVVLTGRKFLPKVPSTIIAVTFGILIVAIFNLPIETIETKFGVLPKGLPSFYIPHFDIDLIQTLLPDAITLALLIAIESLLACVVSDSVTGDKHYSNMELVSQGLSNIACGFFGGSASTAALARTLVNINGGSVSPISILVQAAIVCLGVFALSNVISIIPLAVLAVILVFAAAGMIDRHGIHTIFVTSKSDATIFCLTFFLTLAFDLTVAVYVGVTFASLSFMKKMSMHTHILAGQKEDTLHPLEAELKVELPETIKVVHIDGPLFFGVADRFQSALSAMGKSPKVYILHMKHVSTVDSSGIHAIEVFVANRIKNKYKVVISSPSPEIYKFLFRMNIVRQLGEDNICKNLDEALVQAKALVEE